MIKSTHAQGYVPVVAAGALFLGAGLQPLVYLRSSFTYVLADTVAVQCFTAPVLLLSAAVALLSLALLRYALFPPQRKVYILDFAVHKPHERCAGVHC